MKLHLKVLRSITTLAATIALVAGGTFAATVPHYLITNNDDSQGSSASFYAISGATLTLKAVVSTGGSGNDGIGSVATKRVSVLHNSSQSCVFIPNAGSNDIAGISIATLGLTGDFKGSNTDSGSAAGIGVVNNGIYLYANFTGSQTIATFQIQSGCILTFLQDTPATGLGGNSVLDMAAHGNFLVASFNDGSIESFDISGGAPVPHGDLQYSTAHLQDGSFPSGVDLAADGHYATFGGGINSAELEVSDLSSGKLAPTVVYSNLGGHGAAVSIRLSPDESMIYMGEFNSQSVGAAFFDKTTGVVSVGCTSLSVKGNLDIAGLATAMPTGSGGYLYAAEIENSIGIQRINVKNGVCNFKEAVQSPAVDHKTITMESIEVFPPRTF